jgi:hypothetical protein
LEKKELNSGIFRKSKTLVHYSWNNRISKYNIKNWIRKDVLKITRKHHSHYFSLLDNFAWSVKKIPGIIKVFL